MRIPKLVHQLWKTDRPPARWRDAIASVRRYHRGWDYRLWTDADIDRHVRLEHPTFYPTFAALPRHIMRVDVFRYLLMQDFGGLYCDLDYEFVRPLDYGDAEVVLSLEYDERYGDEVDQIANYVFASAPGHDLWRDILASIEANPPEAGADTDVCIATGPWAVTRSYDANAARYSGVQLLPKPVLSPRRIHGRRERKIYVNSGITVGFHHGWGSWKDRLSLPYIKRKLGRRLGLDWKGWKPPRPPLLPTDQPLGGPRSG
jgi:mannosyltransferase OCH1-like enzyme